MKRLWLYHITLSLVLFSCQKTDPSTYEVDSILEPYAQEFRDQAKLYGQNYDNKGLIMYFTDLTDNKAGVCYYKESPIRIEIDKTFWDYYAEASCAENIRQDVIFHEMGHGFLQRLHFNETFPNEDWKSMMFGGELPHNRYPNLNYRGFRQAYYIEELFTQTSTAPAWSNIHPDFSTVKEADQYSFNFNGEEKTPWEDFTADNININQTNGQLVIKNTSNNPYYITANLYISSQVDFYIEAELSTSLGNTDGYYGLVFGSLPTTSNPEYSIHDYRWNLNKYMLINESNYGTPFIQIYNNDFKATANKLGIRKKDNMLYYYLNDEFIYHNDLDDLPNKGSYFGFYAPANATTYIDNYLFRSASSPTRVRNSSSKGKGEEGIQLLKAKSFRQFIK